jgi:hypothetical protein
MPPTLRRILAALTPREKADRNGLKIIGGGIALGVLLGPCVVIVLANSDDEPNARPTRPPITTPPGYVNEKRTPTLEPDEPDQPTPTGVPDIPEVPELPAVPAVPDLPEDEPAEEEPEEAYYANCAAARRAGAAPLYRGEPGYRKGLDRDGDGTACDR